MLERKLDLANALRDSDQLHKCYDHEHASNGQSQRLLVIASERRDGYDEIEKADMAVFEAEEKMEAAEQNLFAVVITRSGLYPKGQLRTR